METTSSSKSWIIYFKTAKKKKAVTLLIPPVFTWLSPQLQQRDWIYPFWSDQMKFRILSIQTRKELEVDWDFIRATASKCKNIFKALFLTHRKPWTTSLTDLNIFSLLLDHRPPDPSSQVRSDTSGQTEVCKSLLGEIFLLPSCTEQHPCRSARTVLPSCPAPSCVKGHTLPHPCEAEPKHISPPLPSGFSQGKRNSVF